MSTDHTTETPHQRVTKAEACRRLGVSLSTLDRRIAEGQLEVERVQQGLVHRVLVLLPRDMPEVGPDAQGRAAAVSALQERITGLEALLEERGQRLADWEMRYQQQRADHESEHCATDASASSTSSGGSLTSSAHGPQALVESLVVEALDIPTKGKGIIYSFDLTPKLVSLASRVQVYLPKVAHVCLALAEVDELAIARAIAVEGGGHCGQG